ncbi:MAG TPA: exodeoxyribonuclease VII small subunit [Armatimonadota bacterium]
MDNNNAAAAVKTFEEALARLEAIALALDRNDVPLAAALALCAEAATLTRFCRAQLAEAEGKLEQLVEAANGEVRIVTVEDD